MTCPACRAEVEPVAPAHGQAVAALLRDWRIWAFAVAAMFAGGLICGALGVSGSIGAGGGGAATGLVIALRMGKLRSCPACQAVHDSSMRPTE